MRTISLNSSGRSRRWQSGLLLLVLLGCSDATDPPVGTPSECEGQPLLSLAPGQAADIPATEAGGCARVVASDGNAAEYLLLAYSANGNEEPDGARGQFTLSVAQEGALAASPASRVPPASSSGRVSFHDRIRRRDRALAPRPRRVAAPAAFAAGPILPGAQRDFRVCADLDCQAFTAVTATARYVGAKGVVFLDDTVPAGGYTQADLDSVGSLFDGWLYPIDTTAFGRESDIDGNGQVIILLTDQLNRLSGNCNVTRNLVVGYFAGQDLLAEPNSNLGEILYGLVPDPSSPSCAVASSDARRLLPPVLIHELQHLLSFNRHVLLGGGAAEETWLNEGLSQFAEELGGRLVSPGYCVNQNCVNQFIRNNIVNAYGFLQAPELHYLVEPEGSFGTLEERGGNWLFVRWLAEQAAGDSAIGTVITRGLLGADLPGGSAAVGKDNVVAVAKALIDPGASFGQLLGEWHGANYLESRSDLTPAGRLAYRSWNLPAAFDQVLFGPYPLRPDSITGAYRGSGELRGGSGRLVRLLRGPGSPPVAIVLTASDVPLVEPRLSVRRIR